MDQITPSQASHVLAKLKSQGVTQEKLAEAMGCRQSVIAGWKRRGFVPAPQMRNVLAAAGRLGVDLSPDDFVQPLEGEAA